jgi:hypothetical protein
MENCYVVGSAVQTLGGQLAPISPDTFHTFPEDAPGFSGVTSRTGRAVRLVKMVVDEVKKIMSHNTGKFSASGDRITITPGDWHILCRRLGVVEPRNVDSATTEPSFEPNFVFQTLYRDVQRSTVRFVTEPALAGVTAASQIFWNATLTEAEQAVGAMRINPTMGTNIRVITPDISEDSKPVAPGAAPFEQQQQRDGYRKIQRVSEAGAGLPSDGDYRKPGVYLTYNKVKNHSYGQLSVSCSWHQKIYEPGSCEVAVQEKFAV